MALARSHVRTEQLDTLRKEITDDLAEERCWREVGDTTIADKLNDRINLKLDRLRRFSAKLHPSAQGRHRA